MASAVPDFCASVKPMISAPAPLRNSRRGKAFMTVSSRFGRAFDRAHDAHMRTAAAKIVLERGLDVGDAGLGIFLQQSRSLHDHAVDAVAALHRLLFNEGGLQLVRL